MYNRALSTRSYGNLKNGQLPYQTQAEPTVNKNKSSRSKSVKHSRQSLKNPLGRVLSEPLNASTSPLMSTSTPNFSCGHSQILIGPTNPPPIIAQVPQMSTIVSTKSSLSNKTPSDHNHHTSTSQDNSQTQACESRHFEVLNEQIIMKIEQAFIRLMKREKLFNVQLVAIFYLNYGEVEAWCLVHNKHESVISASSVGTRHSDFNRNDSSNYEVKIDGNDEGGEEDFDDDEDDDDQESIDELRNFELTQRIQAILRQYYNKTYQYVILYRDEDLSEYYRCIGIDRRRIRSEKQHASSHMSNTCLQLRNNQIWKNFKRTLRL